MSEWRDMERLHAIMQLRKMESQACNAKADAEKHRRQIRRYQRKIHNYEWHLELGEEPGSSLQSMARAVVQLGTFIDNERRYLQAAEAVERKAAENIAAIHQVLAKLDRWDRWADRLDELFWPVTILRAIWSGHATRNQ